MPCRKCGACCRTMRVTWPNNREMQEYIAARGFKIIQQTKKLIEVEFYHRCEMLDIDGKSCMAHDNGKPSLCQVWPCANKEFLKAGLDPVKSLPEGCGYIWYAEEKRYV